MTTKDQSGHGILLPSVPRRIVSLVPSQTELLHSLGLEEEVVGITRFCIHPESWRKTKPRVGGTKDADVERIRSLKPDLVIANKEENPKETVEEIRSFCPVWTSDVSDIESALDMIRSLGILLDRAKNAVDLMEQLEPLRRMRNEDCIGRAVYLVWKDPWMAAGGDTFIHDMMRCGGLYNALGDGMRYPTVSIDDIVRLKPNHLLLSSEPYPFRERHVIELEERLPDAKVLLVDGQMFSWYGSRMLLGIPYLKELRSDLGKDINQHFGSSRTAGPHTVP